ncbi:MAG: alanine racemase [Leptospirales bacterium]
MIDLDALSWNLSLIREHLSGSSKILPVVKADAYGHGMIPVSRHLIRSGIGALGVMGLEEGIYLRDSGIFSEILVLGGVFPEELHDCISYGLIPVVHHWGLLESLLAFPGEMPLKIHLKFDTGMGRLGFLQRDLPQLTRVLWEHPRISVEGIMTHFAQGDDADRTDEQIAQFQSIVELLAREGVFRDRLIIHMANSSALVSGRSSFDLSRLKGFFNGEIQFWVRPGLLLYGIQPALDRDDLPVRPVMQVEARIISVKTLSEGSLISYGGTRKLSRDSPVGVLGMGYADGLPRELSDWGWGARDNNRFPFLGRVCMDMVMVDLSGADSPILLGDWVNLLGRPGSSSMTAWDIAERVRTIPYEIICRLGNRSPRYYRGGIQSIHQGSD